jgi:hypothetical protein
VKEALGKGAEKHVPSEGRRSLGAWLVSAQMARSISRVADERGEPYLVEIDRPKHTLWATKLDGQYVFTLGHSYNTMPDPKLTWREWLELKGVEERKPAEIREFLTDAGFYDPEGGEVWVPPDLDAALAADLLQDYIEPEYAMYDAPTARAYHYLQWLALAETGIRAGTDWGARVCRGALPGRQLFARYHIQC